MPSSVEPPPPVPIIHSSPYSRVISQLIVFFSSVWPEWLQFYYHTMIHTYIHTYRSIDRLIERWCGNGAFNYYLFIYLFPIPLS